MSEINIDNLRIIRNPSREYLYSIGPSERHGIGIFASDPINKGSKISIFCWKTKNSEKEFIRDESCRFCNHSNYPNAFVDKEGNNFCLFASEKIPAGTEITISYPYAVMRMLHYGIFSLPKKVRCRTMEYIPYIADGKGRTLTDELQEIYEGKWK